MSGCWKGSEVIGKNPVARGDVGETAGITRLGAAVSFLRCPFRSPLEIVRNEVLSIRQDQPIEVCIELKCVPEEVDGRWE